MEECGFVFSVIFETMSNVRLKKHEVESNGSLRDQNQSIKCIPTPLKYNQPPGIKY